MEKREHLYSYDFLEAAKYPRSGYLLNTSLKAAKEEIERSYIHPTRIKIKLIKEESEVYVNQIQKLKGEK